MTSKKITLITTGTCMSMMLLSNPSKERVFLNDNLYHMTTSLTVILDLAMYMKATYQH